MYIKSLEFYIDNTKNCSPPIEANNKYPTIQHTSGNPTLLAPIPTLHKATRRKQPCRMQLNVSLHAPAQGATNYGLSVNQFVKFQSTLPRGERLVIGCPVILVDVVSIHAPTRGATV